MNSRPFTILLVSPDRSLLRRLSKFLEVFGYDVRQATNDQQALAAAQAAQPDYLILDASHGDPVDLQLNRQIRRIWPRGYTFSLLLAEKPEVADVTAGLEAGFDDFLVAPVVFGELLARLRAGARVIEFERRLGDQAGLEPITGLPDREALAAEVAARSQAPRAPLAGWRWSISTISSAWPINMAGPRRRRYCARAAQLIHSRLTPSSLAASLADDRVAILLPHSGSEVAVAWSESVLAAIAEHAFVTGGAADAADGELRRDGSYRGRIARRRAGPGRTEPAARQGLGPQLRRHDPGSRTRNRSLGRLCRRRQAVPDDSGPRRHAALPASAARR